MAERNRKGSGNTAKKNTSVGAKRHKQRKKAQTSHERVYLLPGWFRFLFKLGLVALVAVAAVLIYLDATLRKDLDAVQWELPAQVYARPLEIYPGQSLTLNQLQRELKALGYRFQNHPRTGYAQLSSNRIKVFARPFLFEEGLRVASVVEITFGLEGVQSLRVDGQSRDVFRLEPLLLGSMFPNHHQDRQLVQINEVPKALINALIATEDRDFYKHHGVSPKSIIRAMLANFQAGSVVQGGSTITQQLIKNLYLTRERTYTRKLQEAAMALLVDLRYSKDKIMETYLNEVYLGQDGGRAIHGVMAASYFYFGVPIRELKLHQLATLVAIVKGPAYYNPKRHTERAMKRRNLVLDMMVKEGFVEAKVASWSKRQPMDVVDHPTRSANRFPAFLGIVHRHLKRDYSEEELSRSGLRVFTSLDPQIQWDLEKNAVARIERLAKQQPKEGEHYQVASVISSVDNGEIVAAIGDKNVGFAGFNRALDARRPIGSLAKPAVYLAALQSPEQYTLTTLVKDQPFKIEMHNGDEWQPRNFDKTSHGEVPAYLALAKSYNQATARLGLELGLEQVINTFRQFGFSEQVPMLPAVMLGSLSLSPYEVTKMYQVLAADGFKAPLKVIRAVTDAKGEVLDRYPLNVEQVFDQSSVYLVNYALQVAAREGTGRWLNQVIPANETVFGKTGTSNQQRDSWFAGVKGDYLAVAWMGRDDNEPTELTGSTGALKVWGDVMRHLPASSSSRLVPEGIEFVWVDQNTGLLVDQDCSSARLLPFVAGSAPSEQIDCGDQPKAGRLPGLLERLIDW